VAAGVSTRTGEEPLSPRGGLRRTAGAFRKPKRCATLLLMIVIGTEAVERYFAAHAGDKGIRAARSQYDVWFAIAQRAEWSNPEDVKASHPRASILKGGRSGSLQY